MSSLKISVALRICGFVLSSPIKDHGKLSISLLAVGVPFVLNDRREM